MQIEIKMFGGFTMDIGGVHYDLGATMGKQLQNLFQLLVVNRANPLTRERIMDLLYMDNADPAGSLKYGVFRLRDYFKKMEELGGIPMVVTTTGGYTVNPEIDVVCDVDRFEEVWNRFNASAEGEERDAAVSELISIYRGFFWQTPSQMMWTTEQREYLHNHFLRAAINAANAFIDAGKNEEAIALCKHVLSIDEFCEDISYCYLQALIADEQYARAMKHYKAITKLYMEAYGELPSLKTRKLYTILSAEGGDSADLVSTQEKLREEDFKKGAFYCNYDIFRYMYQAEARRAERSADKAYLLMFEITNAAEMGTLMGWMNRLREMIRSSLRQSDVFTSVNKRQYLVMVTCHEDANAHMLVARIRAAFMKNAIYRVVELRTDVQQIRPM